MTDFVRCSKPFVRCGNAVLHREFPARPAGSAPWAQQLAVEGNQPEANKKNAGLNGAGVRLFVRVTVRKPSAR